MKRRPSVVEMVWSSHTPNILNQLHRDGERVTVARTGLIDVIARAKKPLSVPDILETLAKRGLDVNKTTLYRDLEFFVKQRMVIGIQLNERQKRYELADRDHHHHVVCTSCDRVEDVKLERELAAEERKIELATKFKIERHALEFFGLCATCQA
jgi:Fur family transcriptional regulator, ferric uptake regulator